MPVEPVVPELPGFADALRRSRSVGDVAFVFDALATGSDGYGLVCKEALFAALPKDVTAWLRCGDVNGGRAATLADILHSAVEIVRPMRIEHPSQVYVLALTGIGPSPAADMVRSLRARPFFLGTIDLSLQPALSRHFDAALCSACVLHGDVAAVEGETHGGRLVPTDGIWAEYGYRLHAVAADVMRFEVELLAGGVGFPSLERRFG